MEKLTKRWTAPLAPTVIVIKIAADVTEGDESKADMQGVVYVADPVNMWTVLVVTKPVCAVATEWLFHMKHAITAVEKVE